VLYFTHYRSGGGEAGNVQKGLLNTLKTAIPFINRVENRFPAEGGVDTEDIEHAKLRAPRLLQTRERAVTESDFEFLAEQALKGDVARIKCLQPHASDDERVAAGRVYILVIPEVIIPDSQPIAYKDLRLTSSKQQTLKKYLDERRLLTVHLDIREPAYHWAAVRVVVRIAPTARRTQVEKLILQRLYAFLNPITGGPDREGWPVGQDLFLADIYPSLQGIPGVQAIRGLELFEANETGQPRRTAVNVIEVLAYGVVASGEHQVIFE
jgi:predicted phage baseplate assembly protein